MEQVETEKSNSMDISKIQDSMSLDSIHLRRNLQFKKIVSNKQNLFDETIKFDI